MIPKILGSTPPAMGSAMCEEFVSKLLYSRNIAHIAHLRTKSYAEHVALNGYYDAVVDLADAIAESHMGTTGMVMNLKIPACEYMPMNSHLTQMKGYIEATRDEVSSESHIQNQIDEVLTLITKTLYLLTLS
jgi:hypothetical protein